MVLQEIEQEKQLNRMDDRNGEINPYKELIVNDVEKTEPPMTQMKQWSILSNVLNYVQHSRFNSMNHSLSVRPVNRYKLKPDMGKECRELGFGTVPQNLQEIQVGNGQCIGVLFIIPVIVEIHNHRFEIYTLVSEIHESVDLVLGIKNVFELEGVINSRHCQFEFLNRSVPIYPEKEIILKPDEQKLVKVRAPFIDEISGLAIIKIIDGGTYSTLLLKLKFTCNKAVLDIKNAGKDTMVLRPEEMIGMVDMQVLGIL